MWVSATGGSLDQLPLAEAPSPKAIDQLAMSPSGSVLLEPRKVTIVGGNGARKMNASVPPAGLDQAVRGSHARQVG